jgi:hypothetical protein
MCPLSPVPISSCYPHYQQHAIFKSTSHARLEELTSTNRSRRPSPFIEDTRKRHISMQERAGGTANLLIVIDLLSLATLSLALSLSRSLCAQLSALGSRSLCIYAFCSYRRILRSSCPLGRSRSAYTHSEEKRGSCQSKI